MISVSGKEWKQKKINQNLVEKLKQDYNFSDILSRLIISRKFNEDEIATIDNDLGLNNIFLNNSDFQQSIDLVVSCINNKEKICVLGDYDVDGSAATVDCCLNAILRGHLKKFGDQFLTHSRKSNCRQVDIALCRVKTRERR